MKQKDIISSVIAITIGIVLILLPLFFSYKKIHNTHRDSTSVDGFLYYFKHVQEEGKLDSQYRKTKWTIENEK